MKLLNKKIIISIASFLVLSGTTYAMLDKPQVEQSAKPVASEIVEQNDNQEPKIEPQATQPETANEVAVVKTDTSIAVEAQPEVKPFDFGTYRESLSAPDGRCLTRYLAKWGYFTEKKEMLNDEAFITSLLPKIDKSDCYNLKPEYLN